MENLDIDKLERKNVYKVPENFFAEMQQKVLAETAPKKEAKIFKLNWAYSAAAAVALLFGITFFVTQNENAVNANDNQVIASNINQDQVSDKIKEQQKADAAIAYKTFEEDLTSVTENNQKEEQGTIAQVSEKTNINSAPKKKEITATPEVQVDQILANFTSTELATVAKNSEQDIYLDLYN